VTQVSKEEKNMPARVITNSSQGNPAIKNQNGGIKAPIIQQNEQIQAKPVSQNFQAMAIHDERAKHYTGEERLDLLNTQLHRVRELQEENDYLQREVINKEKAILSTTDPLPLLADIEHRKTMIARNTGEIVQIYSSNKERLKRVKELEAQNSQIQKDMIVSQSKFISTNNMDERTRSASEFFIMKATLERNLQEISNLTKN